MPCSGTPFPRPRARSRLPGCPPPSRSCAIARACRTSSREPPDDLFCALGFLHAQDRLWQMELTRRAGQGRLSEIFGDRTFSTDVFLRTLDLYGHAERSQAVLSPEIRKSLEAYARGVNAFIGRKTGLLEPRLPPEFLLLRHEPEPWRVADSLVTAKMMALNLSTNLNHEMTRLALAAEGLTSAEIEDLLPRDNIDAPPPLPELAAALSPPAPGRPDKSTRPHAPVEDLIGGGASNNWVVSGARTRSGKPLLANDPHLRLTRALHLVSRPPGARAAGGGRDQCRGRDAGRRAPRPARPQRHAGVGLHQHRPRRAGRLHREDQPRRPEALSDARRLAAVRDRADGDHRQGRRRAHRASAAARATGPSCPAPTATSRGCWGLDTWRRCSGRRSPTTTRRSLPACSIPASAASATTWSACASTSCRCRAWCWPTRTATSA